MFSSNLQLIIATIENTINNLVYNWLTDSCFLKKKKKPTIVL